MPPLALVALQCYFIPSHGLLRSFPTWTVMERAHSRTQAAETVAICMRRTGLDLARTAHVCSDVRASSFLVQTPCVVLTWKCFLTHVHTDLPKKDTVEFFILLGDAVGVHERRCRTCYATQHSKQEVRCQKHWFSGCRER
jgi:hypothetical protein